MKELRVRDIMSAHLITLQRGETLNLAGDLMKLARVRHLPVVEHERLVGLVTHRDLLAAQMSLLSDTSHIDDRCVATGTVPVASIMTVDVQTAGPDELAVDAARRLVEHRFGCLPVVDNDILVGIVTEADFLKLVIRCLDDA